MIVAMSVNRKIFSPILRTLNPLLCNQNPKIAKVFSTVTSCLSEFTILLNIGHGHVQAVVDILNNYPFK